MTWKACLEMCDLCLINWEIDNFQSELVEATWKVGSSRVNWWELLRVRQELFKIVERRQDKNIEVNQPIAKHADC